MSLKVGLDVISPKSFIIAFWTCTSLNGMPVISDTAPERKRNSAEWLFGSSDCRSHITGFICFMQRAARSPANPAPTIIICLPSKPSAVGFRNDTIFQAYNGTAWLDHTSYDTPH